MDAKESEVAGGSGGVGPAACFVLRGWALSAEVGGVLLCMLLVLSLGLAAVGSLTVRRAPTYGTWKVAILAGEFGHWLGLAALAAGVAAAGQGWVDGFATWRGGVAAATVGVALVASGLLLRPAWLAWRIGRGLPARLEAAFGPSGAGARCGWFWPRLYLPRRARPVAVRTLTFAPATGEGGLALDFYEPDRAVCGGRPAPCVVVVHGGGWDGGGRDQLPELNHRLARRGLAVAAVSYRLAPAHPWPAQREDLLAAIAFLKARADELGLDAGRLVLLGRSAGGQIAAATACSAADPAIRAVAALYAPHDMRYVWEIAKEDDVLQSARLMRQFLGGPPEGGREELYRLASAQHLVGAGPVPPILLVHGALDELVWVRHSERLAARLAEAGVPHHFLRLPWATHAGDFNPDGPSGQLIERAVTHLIAATTR